MSLEGDTPLIIAALAHDSNPYVAATPRWTEYREAVDAWMDKHDSLFVDRKSDKSAAFWAGYEGKPQGAHAHELEPWYCAGLRIGEAVRRTKPVRPGNEEGNDGA